MRIMLRCTAAALAAALALPATAAAQTGNQSVVSTSTALATAINGLFVGDNNTGIFTFRASGMSAVNVDLSRTSTILSENPQLRTDLGTPAGKSAFKSRLEQGGFSFSDDDVSFIVDKILTVSSGFQGYRSTIGDDDGTGEPKGPSVADIVAVIKGFNVLVQKAPASYLTNPPAAFIELHKTVSALRALAIEAAAATPVKP